MALFRPGPAVAQISGSVGGTTFSHNKGGMYMRNRSNPTNPSSPAQLARRATLATLSASWQDLTTGQRAAWTEWGRQNPGTNALGDSFLLSGQNSFVKLNSKILLDSASQIDTPPIIASPDALVTIVQDGDIGAGATDLTFTGALPSGGKIELWGTAQDSAGKEYVKNLEKFIAFSPADQASPWDNQAAIEAVLGTLVVGQTLHVKAAVYDPATGRSSQFLKTRVLVSTSI